MTTEDFIHGYERALATQEWRQVEGLVHEDACVTFSSGDVHKGKPAVKAAFERNFALIENEKYSISDVYWVRKGDDSAVYLFEFRWTGLIDGRPASGSGRGTAVLTNDGGKWQLLTEHLSSHSS